MGLSIQDKLKLLDINRCKISVNNKFNYYPNILGSYMAGLLESDGNLSFRKNSKGEYTNATIKYCFCLNDLPFAEFLAKKFNMGSVYKIKNVNMYIWSIHKKSDVLKMLILINGHLRTAKFETFKKALEIYKIHHNINIPLLPLNSTPLLEDAWFAGFSDADSCFYVQISKNKKNTETLEIIPSYKLEVSEKYIIEAKEYDYLRDNRVFMLPLVNIFNTNLEVCKRKPLPGYTKECISIKLRISRKNNLSILKQYFTQFPLFSSKYHNYLDLFNILDIKEKAKNSKIRLNKIENEVSTIKNRMNNGRVFNTITWDHLNYFYPLDSSFKDITF